MYPTRDVRGLVRFGIDLQEKDRNKLDSLDQNLASDFIIIDEGKKPELGVSAAMFFVGLLLLFWQVKRVAKPGPAAPQPPQSPMPPLQTPPGTPPSLP
jgi:hypothetical protein